MSHGAAISVTPTKARKMIKEGAKNALKKVNEIKPYKVEMPIELKVEFTEESKSSAEILSRKSYVKKVDTRTIKIEDEDLLEALKKWWLQLPTKFCDEPKWLREVKYTVVSSFKLDRLKQNETV